MAFIVADRVKETASNKPNGATAFNLPDTGATGFRSFDSVLATSDTCPYVATNEPNGGSDWEVGIGTFTAGTPDTLARTTILSSSTGSAIDFSAGADVVVFIGWPANHAASSYLHHTAGTDADTTMAVGQMYVVDMSGWATADRTYTLPATARVGDRIGIMVTSGNASYELIIKPAASDTINGGSAAAEWSRLFLTGECVILRCVTADSAWIVEHDGRIPCSVVVVQNAASGANGTANTFYAVTSVPTNPGTWNTPTTDNGNVFNTSTSRIVARRANGWSVSMTARGVGNVSDGKYYNLRFYDGTVAAGFQQVFAAALTTVLYPTAAGYASLAEAGYLEAQYRAEEANIGIQSSIVYGYEVIQ